MARPSKADVFFHRHPWIRPTLWFLVGIWSIYLIRKPIFFVRRLSWSSAKIICGWWWAILKTLFHLAIQLSVAVPGTALAYIFVAYGIYPAVTIACKYVADLLEKAAAPPSPPRSFQYTHTHTNGESFTHTYTEEDVELLREAILQEAMAEYREEMRRAQERNPEQNHFPKGSGKAQRKARKRNRHAQ